MYLHFIFEQWKATFFPIKIFLILFTTIVLVAGAIQGIASYANYCNDHHDDLQYSDQHKKCDFTNRGKYAADVDFVAVVTFSGVGALLWVSNKIQLETFDGSNLQNFWKSNDFSKIKAPKKLFLPRSPA